MSEVETGDVVLIPTESDITAPGKEKYQNIENDFDEIQENLMTLADNTKTAIDELIALSTQSQHPKAYEALARLIDSAAKINKEAADVIERKRQLYDSLGKKVEPSTINQTYNDNRTIIEPRTTTEVIEALRRQQEKG